jgi:methionyl-tRNA synthetase
MADPFYITTAIAYPNGKPHIGHAYEAIAADVIARHQRSEGRNVRFQTGTDEHGLKMAQKARDLGITPRALCDEMSGHFRSMCDTLNISYDVFQRTTDEAHYKASQAIWQAMEANGDLYLDRYEGWYSVRDEAFYDESELVAGEGARSCLLRERRWNGPSRKAGSSASRPIRSLAGPLRRQSRLHQPRKPPQ